MYNYNRNLAYSTVYQFLVHKKCYINNSNLNIYVFFIWKFFICYKNNN